MVFLPVLEIILIGVLLVVLGGLCFILIRRWRKRDPYPLIGPLFWYEISRTARRGGIIPLRFLYGIVLIVVLFMVYFNRIATFGYDPWDVFRRVTLPAAELSNFAASFVQAITIMQLIFVLFITPGYVAGAIAEERERHTLEFLLATDLSDREIVLSKLLARVCNVGQVILTGLPFLSLLELLGGIDPFLVLASYLGTGMTLLSVASWSIFISAQAKKQMTAIVHSYLGLVVFLFFGCCVSSAVEDMLRRTALANPFSVGLIILTLVQAALAAIFCLGAIAEIRMAPTARRLPPPAFTKPAANPDVLGTLLNLKKPLPPREVRPSKGSDPRRNTRLAPLKSTKNVPLPFSLPMDQSAKKRDRVGDYALLWKELCYEYGVRYPTEILEWSWKRISIKDFVVVTVTLAIVAFVGFITYNVAPLAPEFANDLNVFARSVYTFAFCIFVFMIPLHAATTITKEREKQTLESLILLPVDRREILSAKWLGCMMSVRKLWITTGLILAIGTTGSAIHFLAFPLVFVATIIYASLLACLGMWFSCHTKTSLQAIIRTLLFTLLLGVGPKMLFEYTQNYWQSQLNPEAVEWLERILTYGLTPPRSLQALLFCPGNFLDARGPASRENVLVAIAGMLFYALVALGLWRSIVRHFGKENVSNVRE